MPQRLVTRNIVLTWLTILWFGAYGGVQASEPVPPALELVGVVSSGGGHGQAIVVIGGSERLLSRDDAIDDDWRLAEVHSNHVLLTGFERVMRLDLYAGNSYPVAPQRARIRPVEVHTAASHADLEPGQTRKFYARAEESVDPLEEPFMDAEQHIAEINDPGMTRSFAIEAAPETVPDEEELAANHGGELEPGQSIRFGPVPPEEPAELD